MKISSYTQISSYLNYTGIIRVRFGTNEIKSCTHNENGRSWLFWLHSFLYDEINKCLFFVLQNTAEHLYHSNVHNDSSQIRSRSTNTPKIRLRGCNIKNGYTENEVANIDRKCKYTA